MTLRPMANRAGDVEVRGHPGGAERPPETARYIFSRLYGGCVVALKTPVIEHINQRIFSRLCGGCVVVLKTPSSRPPRQLAVAEEERAHARAWGKRSQSEGKRSHNERPPAPGVITPGQPGTAGGGSSVGDCHQIACRLIGKWVGSPRDRWAKGGRAALPGPPELSLAALARAPLLRRRRRSTSRGGGGCGGGGGWRPLLRAGAGRSPAAVSREVPRLSYHPGGAPRGARPEPPCHPPSSRCP